jgi:MoxR-like ATPase
MEGTYPLPEAQLDRFFFKTIVPYPSLEELTDISRRTTGVESTSLTPAIDAARLAEMQTLVREIAIAPHVERYAARLVLATHPNQNGSAEIVRRYVRYGASPRGVQALVLAGKTLALMDGRLHVSFDDVAAAALPAMRHRLILNFEGEAEGIQSDRLVEQVLEKVEREAAGVG